MPEKLFTLNEISVYLNLSAGEVEELVRAGVIPAYRIGGAMLRFRKEQIDAVRDEITARTGPAAAGGQDSRTVIRQAIQAEEENSFGDRVKDFLYFSDFYLVSFFIVGALLYVIFTL